MHFAIVYSGKIVVKILGINTKILKGNIDYTKKGAQPNLCAPMLSLFSCMHGKIRIQNQRSALLVVIARVTMRAGNIEVG